MISNCLGRLSSPRGKTTYLSSENTSNCLAVVWGVETSMFPPHPPMAEICFQHLKYCGEHNRITTVATFWLVSLALQARCVHASNWSLDDSEETPNKPWTPNRTRAICFGPFGSHFSIFPSFAIFQFGFLFRWGGGWVGGWGRVGLGGFFLFYNTGRSQFFLIRFSWFKSTMGPGACRNQALSWIPLMTLLTS